MNFTILVDGLMKINAIHLVFPQMYERRDFFTFGLFCIFCPAYEAPMLVESLILHLDFSFSWDASHQKR